MVTTKLAIDSEIEIERLRQQLCTSYVRAKITQYEKMMASGKGNKANNSEHQGMSVWKTFQRGEGVV